MKFYFASLLSLVFYASHAQTYSYNQIDESLLKNANAVVRHDEMHVEVIDYKTMHIKSKRVVTVLNEEGNSLINPYQFYDNETKILELKAFVYNKNGLEIKKFKQKDFRDHSATGGGTLYSDNRVKYIDYTPVSYPYTIAIYKEYKSQDTAFLPNWSFLDDYELSVEKSMFSMSFQSGLDYRKNESGFNNLDIVLSELENGFKYTAKNILAIESEPYSESISKIVPKVSVALSKFHLKGVDGYAENWSDFGKWIYNSLLTGQDILDETTKLKIKQLVSDAATDKEKVKRVYEYVQNNTRYISVQLGIGGWQPISALEVDRVKYGDCKGLTNYTKALLKTVGIESYYSVVYGSRTKRDINPDFPQMQGNHVILNVPLADEDLWLECTSQDAPLGYSALFTDDRYVLKVTSEGGEVVKTNNYLDESNAQFINAEINLNDNGSISANLSIASSGTQYRPKTRLTSANKNDVEKYYKENWDYINTIQLNNTSFENNKDDVVFKEEINLNVQNYVSVAGKSLLFAPNMFNRNLYVPKRIRNRKQKFVISRGYLDKDEFIINLPSTLKVESMLSPVIIQNEFGEYSLKMEKINDNTIKYSRKLLVRSNEYATEKYQDFRAFRKKIAQHDNAKIVLIKS